MTVKLVDRTGVVTAAAPYVYTYGPPTASGRTHTRAEWLFYALKWNQSGSVLVETSNDGTDYTALGTAQAFLANEDVSGDVLVEHIYVKLTFTANADTSAAAYVHIFISEQDMPR